MGKQSFTWKTDTLSGNVKAFPVKLGRAVAGAAEYSATRGQGYMKSNAKWTDRTGNARQGLRAITEHRPGQSVIILHHGVPYGIWLETRFSGRYQIILPGLQFTGDMAMRLIGQLLASDVRGSR